MLGVDTGQRKLEQKSRKQKEWEETKPPFLSYSSTSYALPPPIPFPKKKKRKTHTKSFTDHCFSFEKEVRRIVMSWKTEIKCNVVLLSLTISLCFLLLILVRIPAVCRVLPLDFVTSVVLEILAVPFRHRVYAI